jgi:hypothetical protein
MVSLLSSTKYLRKSNIISTQLFQIIKSEEMHLNLLYETSIVWYQNLMKISLKKKKKYNPIYPMNLEAESLTKILSS